MLKIDKYPLGIAIGALAPVLGILAYYFLQFDPTVTSIPKFLNFLFEMKPLLTAVGCISLIVNIALFTFFLNARSDKTAIGIFIMTVMYGIMILYAKFFM